jgi:DegV family protein with EDD domain
MSTERIAIIVDSCADVVPEEIENHNMYVIPLRVNFKEGSYRDRVDIQPEEVYARFEEEIPTTSLPSPQEIEDVFSRVVADGYTHAIAVTISSGLSGTYETVRMVAEKIKGLTTEVIDTRNIAIGSGFTAIAVGNLIAQGASFAKIKSRAQELCHNAKIFFSVSTLEYLKAGGRIGEVTYLLGNLLNATPIITCNEKGIYYPVKIVRGTKTTVNAMVKLAQRFAANFSKYNVAVMHGGAAEKAQEVIAQIAEYFPGANKVYQGQISPALVVHTGPGLVGVGIMGVTD